MKKDLKQRLTAFVDPVLVKRAKVRGALEGFTVSEVVEKALDAYAPRIEKGGGQNVHVKFVNYPIIDTAISETGLKSAVIVSKHIKALGVPK